MRYAGKRILTGIVSLFLLATVTFFLVRLIPGSPFQRGGVSANVVEAIEEEYGLNDPVLDQYLAYMGNLLKGDLGISYQDPGTSVKEIIGRAAPLTVSIGFPALIVSVIVGTGCGIIYAASEKKAVRRMIGSVGMIIAGIPSFAAAILLLIVFSVKLKWLPSSGLLSFSHYILPVTALAMYPAVVITRMTGNALTAEMAKRICSFCPSERAEKEPDHFYSCSEKCMGSGVELYRTCVGVSSYRKFRCGECLYDPRVGERVCYVDRKQRLHVDPRTDSIYGNRCDRA